jgi:hypothetical protein
VPLTLEDVLGAFDQLELTGARSACGALTLGYNPVTRRRAFRLVVEPDVEQIVNVGRIDDVRIESVTVSVWDRSSCRGKLLCSVESGDSFVFEFGDSDGAPGQTRTYPPLAHDDRAIKRLMEKCNCQTAGAESVRFDLVVRFTERREPPNDDVWGRCVFTFCEECHQRSQ